MPITGSLPLIAGEYFLEHYHKFCQESNGNHLEEVFARFANNYSWTTPIKAAAEDYNDYQAIIISDCNYKVLWVDRGFTEMTGYNSYEIIGNKPTMLHGPGTIDEERSKFHKGIATKECFTASITNYRKNGEAYLCKVKIVPLFNNENQLTHYIAFEREVA